MSLKLVWRYQLQKFNRSRKRILQSTIGATSILAQYVDEYIQKVVDKGWLEDAPVGWCNAKSNSK